MPVVQFYPIDFDYDSHGSIRIYGRTLDNNRITVIDNSVKPFFYLIGDLAKIKNKVKNIKVEDKDYIARVLSAELVKKNYLNREVEALKVIIQHPRDFPLIKDYLKEFDVKILESDISFVKRYLIEKDLTPLALSEVTGEIEKNELGYFIQGEVKQVSEDFYEKPKILAFDIEIYGSITTDKAKKEPILTIGFYSKDFKKVITWKKFKDAPVFVEFVDSEQDLILKFKEIIQGQQPDYIVGYFSDGFDFPYIKERADKYKIRLNLGLDNSIVAFKKSSIANSAKIKGIPHLDIFKFIRKVFAGEVQLDSYSLDVVAKEILGEGKLITEHSAVDLLWDLEKIEDFCNYNLRDAELTYRICEKLLPNLNELVKVTGLTIYDVCRVSYGQLVENYLIKRTKEFNELIPNRPSTSSISDRITKTYQGAFVMEPKPGLYNNIAVFDFRSLYPSIIISKNICPSTLNFKEGYKTPEIIDEDGNKVTYYFDYKKEGFIPRVLRDLITRRNRVKEILKKEKSAALEARSYALKTVANATYGMLAFFGARWYSRESAASVTAFARDYIQKLIRDAEKEFNVIYSDTDAIALTYEGKTKEDTLNFVKKINEELPELMELELENFYTRGIFVSKKTGEQGAKKKYALIDENNEIKIRGFETIRRDWSLIARNTQLKIIEIILKENSPEKALDYIHTTIEHVRNKKISLKDTILEEQIKQKLSNYVSIGPHVAIARKLQQKGFDITPGTTVSFVITQGSGLIRDRAKIPNECREDEYDPDYYINNQIIPSVEKIFEVLGYKRENLLDRSQSNLSEFLK